MRKLRWKDAIILPLLPFIIFYCVTGFLLVFAYEAATKKTLKRNFPGLKSLNALMDWANHD